MSFGSCLTNITAHNHYDTNLSPSSHGLTLAGPRLPLQPKGVPRRFTPILKGVREEAVDGAYTLVLEFAKRKVRSVNQNTDACRFLSVLSPRGAQRHIRCPRVNTLQLTASRVRPRSSSRHTS